MASRQYPEYPHHSPPRLKRFNSETPSSASYSAYNSAAALPRPAPAALRGLQGLGERERERDGEKRHSRRRADSQPKCNRRSLAPSGAVCANDLCDSPDAAADEKLFDGPDGLELCRRCYKRFRVERRRAREDGRAVTDDWRRPRRRRSRVVDEEGGRSRAQSYDEKAQKSYGERPISVRRESSYETSGGRGLSKEAVPVVTPLADSELGRSETNSELHDVSKAVLKEHDRRTAKGPREHRSHRERDERGHERRSHARDMTGYDEAEYFKYGRAEEDGEPYYRERRRCCSSWSPRKRCLFILAAVISAIVLITIIALAATLTRKKAFHYTPSTAQVNSTLAFQSGGGTHTSVNDTNDGIGAGSDTYTYYQGNYTNFPNHTQWVSFPDMWTANLETFQNSCGWLHRGKDNTPAIISDIYNAIQDRANASLVDHRIILATILQETNGCPLNPSTTSSGGTRNPGLMQSHNGHEYDASNPRLSILQMVQDGTQGTKHGWGIVDNLNTYGNPYLAMRGYNSGYVPNSGNLSEKAGATACYVSDIANRLTGWVRAESKCVES